MTVGLVLPWQSGLVDAGPCVDAVELTSVGLLAVRNERLRALVDAYLNGPGRRHFRREDPSAAQVLLADADSASARAALQQWLQQHGRPAVAIAARDPMIDGALWLPHPFSFDALQRAVAAAQGCAPAQTGAPQAPHRPAALAGTKLRPAAGPSEPGLPSAAARTPFGRRAEGDWTGTVVWLALGLLTIAWLTTLLGWRPAAEAPAPRAQLRQTPAPVMPDDALRRAVADSLRDYRGHTPQELAEIRRQLESMEAEQRLVAERVERREPWAQLTRPGASAGELRWNPQRLPAEQMALARPADAQAEAFRRTLDEAVARALAHLSSGRRNR